MLSSKTTYEYISVFDSIPYFGGSKVASRSCLKQLQRKGIDIKIFTQDVSSWQDHGFSTFQFNEPACLRRQEYGLGFYIKTALLSALYLMNILKLMIIHRSRPTTIVGVSGPGVDAAMYLTAKLLGIKTIQLVHGPIGHSRLSKFLLANANVVGYLTSERQNITHMTKALHTSPKTTQTHQQRPHLVEFENGIDQDSWPAPSHSSFIFPEVFWAASLLKWKRLDLFQHAFNQAVKQRVMRANIAYITPENTLHPVCDPPTNGPNIEAIEKPRNLDAFRSRANIFVSTSESEPFGLSILEALAAGLCVVIPEDGAYWDTKLKHGYNCIKYSPNCSDSLTKALISLANDMSVTKTVAENGKKMSEGYKAETSYRELVAEISPSCPLNGSAGFNNENI